MDAIRFLYIRYKDNVYGYVLSILRDQHEAEDVTQHVFLKLMSVIHKYQPREVPFTSWMLRVARNVAVDHLRQRRPMPVEEVYEPSQQADDSGRDRRWGIEQALEELPEDQRGVVVLRHLVGLSPGRDRRPDGSHRGVGTRPAPSCAGRDAPQADRGRVRADRPHRRRLRHSSPRVPGSAGDPERGRPGCVVAARD